MAWMTFSIFINSLRTFIYAAYNLLWLRSHPTFALNALHISTPSQFCCPRPIDCKDSMHHPPPHCLAHVSDSDRCRWGVTRSLSVFTRDSDVKGSAGWAFCCRAVYFIPEAFTVFRSHVTLRLSTTFSHGDAVAHSMEPGGQVTLLGQKDGCLWEAGSRVWARVLVAFKGKLA